MSERMTSRVNQEKLQAAIKKCEQECRRNAKRERIKKRQNTNINLRYVMLITSIIGIIATILFVIFFDVENYKILLVPVLFYVVVYLVIGYGFRWKFGKQTYWIASLCFSPFTFELFAFLIIEYIFSWEIAIGFIEWFSMIGVTISVLIFEYKFATHNKK